jgi:hypothetical protein
MPSPRERLGSVLLLLFATACGKDLEGPAVTVIGVTPPIVCNDVTDPATTVTVAGTGFAPLASDTLTDDEKLLLPEVSLVPRTNLAGGGATGTPIAMTGEEWRSQRQMLFGLPDGVTAGIYDVQVTNADGTAASLASGLAVIPPPQITGFEPAAICTAQFDNTITVIGDFFLFSATGDRPTVTINGVEYDAVNPQSCSVLPAPAGLYQLCQRFDIVIPMGDLATAQTYDVTVRNPSPAGCESDPATLTVAGPPTIDTIVPRLMCVDGGTLSVTGTGFQEGATLALGDATPIAADVTSATTLTAEIAAAQVPGTYDVTVTNPDSCEATAPDAVTIVDRALLFFVDPPVLWSGISVQVTIYASGINGAVSKVELQLHGDDTTRQELTFTQDPLHPNRIQAVVPAGLPAGSYDFIVTDEACVSTLENGLAITDEASLILEGIEPPFGWTQENTAVTITADTSAGPGFEETPRVYLSPSAGGTLAVATRAVTFQTESTVTAVVPAGLAPGTYDVIVINPSGTVGVLTGADRFTVTTDAPPSIVSVSPGSVDAGTATTVTVSGGGLISASSVQLFCQAFNGTVQPTINLAPASVTATSLEFVTPSTLVADTVCVVRVNNPDGSFGDFSAISVTNPASNLGTFLTSVQAPARVKPLTVSRFGLFAASGRATAANRFLYAVGGATDETSATAFSSVESTPVDRFGAMGGWTLQRNSMTVPRGLVGGARIGQFIYAAGGTDGTNVLDTVERARILDPLDVPEFTDVDLRPVDADGLTPGNWVYRVTGLRAATDPSDPGGETLPSEPINVTLPDLSGIDKVVEVTITWEALPGVVGYRIYRTRAAGQGAGTAQALADVTGTAFTDTGAAPAVDAATPLPIGSLGRWHVVATMTSRRQAAGVVAARGQTAGTWFLYVGGGFTAASTLDTYEYLPVTIAADGSQTVGTFTLGGKNIGSARGGISAWAVDDRNIPATGTSSYVYFGSGLTINGAAVNETVVGLVGTNGELVRIDALGGATTQLSPADAAPRAGGAGSVAANGFLFVFGGSGFAGTTGGDSAEVCRSGLGGCVGAAPELRNWNSLGGGGILIARSFMGVAIESAFIYVIGGGSATTERSIW